VQSPSSASALFDIAKVTVVKIIIIIIIIIGSTALGGSWPPLDVS
jgi:hypothetical protein